MNIFWYDYISSQLILILGHDYKSINCTTSKDLNTNKISGEFKVQIDVYRELNKQIVSSVNLR